MVHGSECSIEQVLEFDDVTKYLKSGKEQGIDKIRVAKEIAAQPADFSVLDLAKKMGELIDFIRSANGILPVADTD